MKERENIQNILYMNEQMDGQTDDRMNGWMESNSVHYEEVLLPGLYRTTTAEDGIDGMT